MIVHRVGKLVSERKNAASSGRLQKTEAIIRDGGRRVNGWDSREERDRIRA